MKVWKEYELEYKEEYKIALEGNEYSADGKLR